MKIRFTGNVPVEHEDIMRNVEFARQSGLPYVKPSEAHDRVLAIVGGGPSLLGSLEELKAFQGDIWAVNGACAFLRTHGIDSTMIGVDPHVIMCQWAPGTKKAILCSRTDYRVWPILKDADVQLFDLIQENTDEGIRSGSSTATCAFDLATDMGYRTIIFYGCESSFPGEQIGTASDQTHAYCKEVREHRMLVECGGAEYLTAPDFFVQATEIASMIKEFPTHFSERCGGLLRALVQNDDYDIIKVSRAMMATLELPKPELEAA